MNRHLTRFKTLAGGTLIGAAALLSAPAHAGLANLDAQLPMVYNHGESFVDGGLKFTAQISAFAQSLGISEGMGGEILNSNDANSCGAILDCPTGTMGNFYAGWNDGSVDVGGAGGFYRLRSLRFAFFAPTGGLADGSYGQLVLRATTEDGSSVMRSADFAGQDGNGHFVFSTWMLDGAFTALRLSNVNISACLFDGNGGCFNVADWAPNAAQFAIDDLQVELPLPGTAPLLLLGLAGLAALRRRAR
jgi:hypothetical protein